MLSSLFGKPLVAFDKGLRMEIVPRKRKTHNQSDFPVIMPIEEHLWDGSLRARLLGLGSSVSQEVDGKGVRLLNPLDGRVPDGSPSWLNDHRELK